MTPQDKSKAKVYLISVKFSYGLLGTFETYFKFDNIKDAKRIQRYFNTLYGKKLKIIKIQ